MIFVEISKNIVDRRLCPFHNCFDVDLLQEVDIETGYKIIYNSYWSEYHDQKLLLQTKLLSETCHHIDLE